MKLKELKPILYSILGGHIQFVIIYEHETNSVLDDNHTVEWAIEQYGDREVKRISSNPWYLSKKETDFLIITI